LRFSKKWKKNEKKNEKKYLYNVATPLDIVIKDIKYQLSNNNKYKINLIYEKKDEYNYESFEDPNRIFGWTFVENNKDNIKLIINGRESKLIEKYNLKKGVNNIELIILNKLTNLEGMFYKVFSLKNIEELKYLNTKEVNNFSYMFWGCSSLSDIKPLQNWKVSKGNDFSGMFSGCELISDIKGLENWNVSKGNNFSYMFSGCSSLSDIKPLQNWNVSNGNYFSYMFSGCSFFLNIKPLQNWNASQSKLKDILWYFSYLIRKKYLKKIYFTNYNNN